MEIKIEGMTCAVCSSTVEKEVLKIKGVSSCVVNLIAGKANIKHNLKDEKIIIEAIEKLGFKANYEVSFDDKTKKYKEYKKKFILSSIFTIILLYMSMLPMMFDNIYIPSIINMHDNPINYAITQMILTLIVMIIGRNFYISAIKKIKNPNMDVLVSIGTLSAFIYSIYTVITIMNGNTEGAHNLYFESSATIITLILLGKTLETKALAKSTNAIKKLMELTPDTAIILDKDENQIEVKTSEIKLADIVVIKPGNKIPVDGLVIEGKTYINESMLTGESLAVTKNINDEVYAGTINQNGTILVRVTKINKDTMLSKIVEFIENANATKAPIAKLADVISGKFVPIVVIIATLSGLLWLQEGIEFALSIFISVLVIACPCALGLATPTAIMVATGRSAKLGILFKNSESLESISKTNTIVFDKTGTLTKGTPVVTDIINYDFDEEELKQIIYSGELLSEHPIAKAVCESLKGTKKLDIKNYQVEVGTGIKFTYNKNKVTIGKITNKKDQNKAINLSKEGKTPIAIYLNNKLIGIVAIADEVREESKTLIQELKHMNFNIYMLTGDNEITANAIAKKLNIENVIANVLPTKKASAIESLKLSNNKVIMVGDGINDAPALTTADIAIAISSGSDIAMECADVVILNDNIDTIIKAIKIGKKTLKNIKINLFLAFIYNIIFIPIACGILYLFNGPTLNPMMAAFAMSLSSVSVVSNALRLNIVKLK